MSDVSEKSAQEKLFIQYRAMIEQSAWKFSRIYSMNVEDLRAQAYLIFCEAFRTYNKKKASFSTHLYLQLKTLNDYCVMQVRRNNHSILPEDTAVIWWDSFFEFEAAIERLESKKDLSQDAQDILDFILGREWEDVEAKRKTVPRFSKVRQIYSGKNWSSVRTKKAWDEIKTWWRASAVHYQEA